jgi:hypothetical protein
MSNTAVETVLPFANAATNMGLTESPLLSVSVGGGGVWRELVMDTGSTGIVISEGLVGPDCTRIDPQPDLPVPGYSSSSRNNYEGYWATASVEIRGGGQVVATAARLRVFVVTNFPTTSMMGVGVRWPDQSANPFMNLAGLRKGYIVSADGVRFGYGDPAAEGFITFPFREDGTAPLEEPHATVSLVQPQGSGIPPYLTAVPLLFDTGIDYMIVTPPTAGDQPDHAVWEVPVDSPRPGEQMAIVSGVRVRVTMDQPAGGAETTLYDFDTAACPVFQPQPPVDPGVPFLVRFGISSQPGPGIINTGRHLLHAYDYLVDLEDRIIGLRPR